MWYGMKRDFNAWLETLGEDAPVRTLTELREWNVAHRQAGSMKYEQATLDESDALDLELARAEYEEDRARDLPARRLLEVPYRPVPTPENAFPFRMRRGRRVPPVHADNLIIPVSEIRKRIWDVEEEPTPAAPAPATAPAAS